ncbi:MAG: histidinol dehydrogenase [Balneola sp.]
MKTYTYKELSKQQLKELMLRPKIDFVSIFQTVQPIIDDIRSNGNSALRSYTKKFDSVSLDEFVIDPKSIEVELSKDIKQAIDTAFNNIFRFHRAQRTMGLNVETMPGVKCSRVIRPIQKIGLYVPGGTAVLPSSAMMLAIPAMIAGCEQIVLATPPKKDGNIAPEIVYIAQKAGVHKILKAGGAQAIAALALGTETVPKVDKILGPGNQFVTAAKMLLQNSDAQISIDMPAGPSEVLVIADKSATPAFVAADLLSQAEHGKDSQVVLVATNDFDLETLEAEIQRQLNELPRKKIAQQALEHSYIVQTDSLEEAFSFSNEYAPEHLIVNTTDAEDWKDSIKNAGSVFLGNYTPESVGDYASGTNHTLPTYGYARMYSGVNLSSYQKSITMQSLSQEGLKNIGPTVEILAELEELQAHKNAVSIRLKSLEEEG